MIKYIKFLCLTMLIACIMMSVSCKKSVDNSGGAGAGAKLDTANSTLQDRLYDSMYFYALQTYYWNTQLPTYASFLPRQYKTADTLTGLENELFQFTRFPKDASGNLYEQRIKYDVNGNPQPDNTEPKYSYILPTRETVNGGAGDYMPFENGFSKNLKMTLDGKDSSLGFVPGLLPASFTYDSTIAINKDSTICIVRWVTKGSPADQSGLKRGDVISKINGQAFDFDNDNNAITEVNNALNGSNISLTIYNPINKTSKDISFQQRLYTYNPIFKSEVLNYGAKKIGYIAFQTFSDMSNAQTVLDTAFQSYSSKGITDLVVDLRYNGGGYVNTSEYFMDLIAPSSANGKVMYTAYYNALMVNKQATILKKQPLLDDNNLPTGKTYFDIDYSATAQTTNVQKAGAVNGLTNVYFIVSSGTASASELLINNLKPYISGKITLIGAAFSDGAKTTYGKPVGFFELKFGQYSMWIPNFETKNATGGGEYYQGMNTDYQIFDDITHDFGDPKESCLSGAIYLISGVNTTASVNSSMFNTNKINKAILMTHSIGNVYRISNMVIKPKRVIN